MLDAELVAARAEAEASRHLHALVTLDSLEGPWLVMRGETGRLDVLTAHLTELDAQVSISGIGDAVPSLHLAKWLWEERFEEVLALTATIDEQSLLPTGTVRAAMLCRAGDLDAARAYVLRHPDASRSRWPTTRGSAPWAGPLEPRPPPTSVTPSSVRPRTRCSSR